jgi:TetR/AcrR family fatty acid metabolism transcriptional regulator
MPVKPAESQPAPETRRRRESGERRQRILEAARQCFGELGFAGATVEAIAAAAGVSNGLLYQFFRNKEELFEVVVEDLMRDWVRALVPRGELAGGTASERLEAMLRGSVEFCRSHPLLPALLMRDRALQLERFAGISTERLFAYRDLVASILREGVEAGEFRADLDVRSAADIVCQLQAEYSSRAYRRDPMFPSSPELIDALVRFIRDALRV